MRGVSPSGERYLLRADDLREITSRTSVISILILLSFFTGLASTSVQEQDKLIEPPLIVRVEPAAAAPLTGIQLEGRRLGAHLDKGKRALFVQESTEYESVLEGSSYERANLKEGWQSVRTIVPEAIKPGSCQLIVEVEGRRSQPFDFQINVPATAPVLNRISPQTPRPTETIWIDGSGFAASDEIQLIDSAGQKHRFQGGRGGSHANTMAIPLPKNMAAGEAGLRLIEHRSGTNQQSNLLSFTVVRGPTPLAIYEDWLMPVAPGQWVDLIVGSYDPLKGADRIEVSFRQNEQFVIVATRTISDLRVQVPTSLQAGTVTLETRTIAKGQASDWSRPISYQLLEKPAPAKIYGLEIQPVQAEVAFRQNGQIVAVVTVSPSEYPRVRLPVDKLSPGGGEILTRFWRGGVPTEWLFENYGFDWPSESSPEGILSGGPFIREISFGPETPKALIVYPGERLVLSGTFPVESPEGLRVILEREEHDPVVLNARSVGNVRRAKIELPATLDGGEWDVTVQSVDDRASMKLPVKLKVIKG